MFYSFIKSSFVKKGCFSNNQVLLLLEKTNYFFKIFKNHWSLESSSWWTWLWIHYQTQTKILKQVSPNSPNFVPIGHTDAPCSMEETKVYQDCNSRSQTTHYKTFKTSRSIDAPPSSSHISWMTILFKT